MIRKVVETRFIWNDNNIMTEKQMKRIVVLGLLALGLLGMTHANAGLLRLDATSTEPDNRSDFFVTFDDGGDGQLQAEEIISFSGLTLFADATVYDVLLGVPTIPSISTISNGMDAPARHRHQCARVDMSVNHSSRQERPQ